MQAMQAPISIESGSPAVSRASMVEACALRKIGLARSGADTFCSLRPCAAERARRHLLPVAALRGGAGAQTPSARCSLRSRDLLRRLGPRAGRARGRERLTV